MFNIRATTNIFVLSQYNRISSTKATGPDVMAIKVVKISVVIIAPRISSIYNASIYLMILSQMHGIELNYSMYIIPHIVIKTQEFITCS